MTKELKSLLARWQAQTGEAMPIAIQRLSLDKIRTAVERTEAGEIVFVPASVQRETADSGSMLEWDKHGEYS